ncbi:transcription elongation factor S-II-like isoform X2 [Cimex lectularius]|nr:transcription elongation factor S-II-like isoform X2 [Cimex lectularius]
MAAVLEIVTILERTPITKEALETTRLGRDINELRRKTRNESLAKRAKDLVRRWRDLILPQNDVAQTEATQQNGSSRNSAQPSRGGSTVLRPHPISPAISLPNSDKSSVSPVLSTKVEAVPKTHAANKRLRKEPITPHAVPSSDVKKSSLESSPELPPNKRVKLEVASQETTDGPLRLNGDHYDSVGSDCEIVSVTPALPKQKTRKKAPKDRTQKESVDDIVKEKIASIARIPKVKTTQELLAGLQSRTGDSSSNSILPVVDHNVAKNKTEHIARFLRSQGDESEIIDVESTNDNETPSNVGSNDAATAQSSAVKEEAPTLRTPEEILARLPPLDLDSINWDETPLPSPTTQEVTSEDVDRVLNQQIPGLNGNYDESYRDEKVFREWHEVVSRTSINSDLLHILPYVVID